MKLTGIWSFSSFNFRGLIIMREGSFPRDLNFCSIALKMSTSAFKLGGSGNLITLVVREEDLSSEVSLCLSADIAREAWWFSKEISVSFRVSTAFSIREVLLDWSEDKLFKTFSRSSNRGKRESITGKSGFFLASGLLEIMRKLSLTFVNEESSFFRASQVLRIDGEGGGLPTEGGAGEVGEGNSNLFGWTGMSSTVFLHQKGFGGRGYHGCACSLLAGDSW